MPDKSPDEFRDLLRGLARLVEQREVEPERRIFFFKIQQRIQTEQPRAERQMNGVFGAVFSERNLWKPEGLPVLIFTSIRSGPEGFQFTRHPELDLGNVARPLPPCFGKLPENCGARPESRLKPVARRLAPHDRGDLPAEHFSRVNIGKRRCERLCFLRGQSLALAPVLQQRRFQRLGDISLALGKSNSDSLELDRLALRNRIGVRLLSQQNRHHPKRHGNRRDESCSDLPSAEGRVEEFPVHLF